MDSTITVTYDYSEYKEYAEDVVSGKRVACESIILACRRYLSWFDRQDLYFDVTDVEKKIKFISKLKHFTGEHNGKPFILLPWQKWVISGIFGFKYRSTNLRVVSNVFCMISRKNGKTALASAIALCCLFCDNEPNAEIELVANSRQQAAIAFDMCYNFTESVDPKKKYSKRYRDTIKIPKTKSKIQVLSSDSMGLDGYNASAFILDEFHSQKTWDLYNVMKSSQGMRRQPLSIVITTAGFLLNGYPCYEYRKTCIEILKGLKNDDTTFAAIFELDEKDDWEDPTNWEKCSPSIGQTVSSKYMQDQIQAAKNQPTLETGVLTKNFNRFCQSSTVWIPDKYIVDSFVKDLDLSQIETKDVCYAGVDLGVVSDLTAWSVLFPPNPKRKIYPDKYIFKSYIYVPTATLNESVNKGLYKEWEKQGYVFTTALETTDYEVILRDMLQELKPRKCLKIGFDRYNAIQFSNDAKANGLRMFEYPQNLANFNAPTKYFEMLVRQGKVIIDYNPAVEWCIGNVELKVDHNDNCKPIKAGNDQTKKIDPIISMLESLGCYLATQMKSGGSFTA